METIYPYTHDPIAFDFAHTPERFIVDEIAAVSWRGKGERVILHLRKTNITTLQAVDIVAKAAGIDPKEVGYAGLKDKHATATQYLCIPKFAYKRLRKALRSPRIEILETYLHDKKLKIGDLKGNAFEICLHRVDARSAKRIESIAQDIVSKGFANYFGYQRFGHTQADEQGETLVRSGCVCARPSND